MRDYIHVEDLARAHVLALEALEERSRIYNLGCGGGFSVREVLEVVGEVTGREVKALVGERRAGDPAVLVASSDLARAELGWRPERENLRDIVSSAWSWLQRHPDGYATAHG